ncbi:MlaD family protein [Nocardia carnea]|uniref:MlaD family protein n=1 Tax=Nocardia carnea TaxID=37328 RepID=UPI00245715C9|nr:MlaD family protein [Nocardia carnea]
MQRKLSAGPRVAATTRRLVRRIRHGEKALGAFVVLVAVTALATTSLLYVRPPGQRTVAFETTDASALGVGLEVRVAGVTVGKVTNISLLPESVRVEAKISDETFVGSDSRIEVRMLTPVGGYAVTLVPLGVRPLGDAVIPAEQVVAPYSIADVLQAAPQVTDKVEGSTVDANIDQVAAAFEHNTTSVSSLIAGITSLATVLDRQRDQVREISGLAAEYLRAFDGDRAFVFDLIRQIDLVVSTYNNTHVGFNEAYRLLGDVLMRVQPLEKYYLDHREEVITAAGRVRDSLAGFTTQMGPAIDQLQNLRAQLAAWLTPEGLATLSGGTILASGICVPLPGRMC